MRLGWQSEAADLVEALAALSFDRTGSTGSRGPKAPGHEQRAERMYRQHSTLQLPIVFEADASGTHSTNAIGTVTHPWPEVLAVVETERALVLIVRPHAVAGHGIGRLFRRRRRAAYPIPKRAAAGGQLAELRALIEAHTHRPIRALSGR